MRKRSPSAALAGAALTLVMGCAAEREDLSPVSRSPNARPEIVDMLRSDLEAERHPADGGGRAWIEEGPRSVAAGSWNRWRLVYEAGPLGIAEGGMLFLQVSPFWGWSTPQTVAPEFEGFTRVTTEVAEITLETESYGQQLLGVRVTGRELRSGERVVFDYGAGPARARADRYAESASPFWLAVDGDGDGVRRIVDDSPSVEVRAARPARLSLSLTSTARPGERVRLSLAVLDAAGNAGFPFAGAVRLSAPEALSAPPSLRLEAGDEGRTEIWLTPSAAGTYRILADAGGRLQAESNPLRVSGDGASILWADLHGHSAISDGTGTPTDYLIYARHVAGLDVVALTDHDHWGLRPLARRPDLWEEIRRETERFHQPGRFVTLPGFEWTSWLHGHRHVLFFDGRAEILSSVDPAYESPDLLWSGLRGRPALTFAHHSAGEPIATNWDFAPDPELEPVTEIVSVHGSSEAIDTPRPVAGAIAGNTARDALGRGYRLGFIGSGDSHDGHPGLAHLASPSGGLAALVGAERTRESVLETLRARRVYATNGPRILLETTLDGRPMGSTLPTPTAGDLRVRVVATGPLDRIDVIRSGSIVATVAAEGRETELALGFADLEGGEFLYVRVVQDDGGAAWSSPFFFD